MDDDDERLHPVVVLTEGHVFGSYGDRRSRTKDPGPIARPGVERAKGKTPVKATMGSCDGGAVVARRHHRNDYGWPKEENAMSEHVAFNIVSELFADELGDVDSGNEGSLPPPSPLDNENRTYPPSWSWSDADPTFQHVTAAAAATSYETPLGSISSFGSISSADSALMGTERNRRSNPWQHTPSTPSQTTRRSMEADKSAPVSAGSSPPPPQPSPAQSKDDVSANRHSYPKAASGSPAKTKQPLLATPIIHNGMVTKDPPRFYRSNGVTNGVNIYKPSPGYPPPSRYVRGGGSGGGGGTYGASGTSLVSSTPSNWQYTIHEDQTRMNYSRGGSNGSSVMLRFNDRQNRPPRLANKSRRFSDGILYTGQQQPEGTHETPQPPAIELNPPLPPPQASFAPVPPPPPPGAAAQMHLYPGMVRAGVKLRKGGAVQVGRSNSFNHPPRSRPQLLAVPRSSTPGSSPPVHHDQRMSMPQGGGGGYSAFSSLRLGYHKGFRPHSAPNPFLTPNGHPGMPPPPPSQYDPSRPKASHELHLRIELCIEETKALGQERRRVELDVASYLGRNSYPLVSSVPRLPPNPTRLDKLINDQFKEHAKMEAIVTLMERHRLLLGGGEMSGSLDNWLAAIQDLYVKRQDEREALSDPSRRNQWDENEVLGLAASAEELTRAIQGCRMVIGSLLGSGGGGENGIPIQGFPDLDQIELSLAAFRFAAPEGGHTA